MNDFFKYLAAGDDDKEWGLYLKVAGKANILPKANYPSHEHPSGYYFSWENGRVLQEFQINYITAGFGEIENSTGSFQVKPGTLIITRPGIWHRYKPVQNKGWVENYIGFDGEMAKQLMSKTFLNLESPLIYIGIHEELIDAYYKIFDLVKSEKPGFQQIASGMIIKLLGYIVAFQKQRNFHGKKIESIIQKVCFCIRENIDKEIDIASLAKENAVGYSYFRKMFKKYTGVAPHQYYLELKLIRAKELILSTDKTIKEISYELGFQSLFYFSRLFKQKTGMNPTEMRKLLFDGVQK